jgi:hypothetical protein
MVVKHRKIVKKRFSKKSDEKPVIVKFAPKQLQKLREEFTKAARIINKNIQFNIAQCFQFGKVPIVWEGSEKFNLLKKYGFLDMDSTVAVYSGSNTALGYSLNNVAKEFYDDFRTKNPELVYRERVLLSSTAKNISPFLSDNGVSLPGFNGMIAALEVLTNQGILGPVETSIYSVNHHGVEGLFPDDLRVGYAFGDIKSQIPKKAVLFVADVEDKKKLMPSLEHLRKRHGLTHTLYNTFINVIH